MQTESNPSGANADLTSPPQADAPVSAGIAATAPGQLRVIKRNGTVVPFEGSKISVAITKAFLAVEGGTAAASSRIHETVAKLTDQVTATFQRRMPSGGTIHIEDIQDQVELSLMRAGEHKIARDYVIYREEQARKRARQDSSCPGRPGGRHRHQRDPARRQPDTAGPGSPAHHRLRSLHRPDRRHREPTSSTRPCATCTTGSPQT